jgi:hypothetical protein
MQHHKVTFFGHLIHLVVDSRNWHDNYAFFQFIKKNPEKKSVSNGETETKSIKLSIMDLIAIRDLLRKGTGKWATIHHFNNIKTPIRCEFIGESFVISIAIYEKKLHHPETAFLCELLTHFIEEKIEYATGVDPAVDSFRESFLEKNQRDHNNTRINRLGSTPNIEEEPLDYLQRCEPDKK